MCDLVTGGKGSSVRGSGDGDLLTRSACATGMVGETLADSLDARFLKSQRKSPAMTAPRLQGTIFILGHFLKASIARHIRFFQYPIQLERCPPTSVSQPPEAPAPQATSSATSPTSNTATASPHTPRATRTESTDNGNPTRTA